LDALEALQNRTASPRLVEPAPTPEELADIYKAGVRAPDHGMLRPWRFLTITGEGREAFGQVLAENLAPESEEQKNKLLNAPMRAPMIIAAIAEIQDHPKIPRIEQVCAVAAAVQNMSVAIHALGYSSIWRTGKGAFNDGVKTALGFTPKDEIVGFLYVGTPTLADRPVPVNNIEDYVSTWG